MSAGSSVMWSNRGLATGVRADPLCALRINVETGVPVPRVHKHRNKRKAPTTTIATATATSAVGVVAAQQSVASRRATTTTNSVVQQPAAAVANINAAGRIAAGNSRQNRPATESFRRPSTGPTISSSMGAVVIDTVMTLPLLVPPPLIVTSNNQHLVHEVVPGTVLLAAVRCVAVF